VFLGQEVCRFLGVLVRRMGIKGIEEMVLTWEKVSRLKTLVYGHSTILKLGKIIVMVMCVYSVSLSDEFDMKIKPMTRKSQRVLGTPHGPRLQPCTDTDECLSWREAKRSVAPEAF